MDVVVLKHSALLVVLGSAKAYSVLVPFGLTDKHRTRSLYVIFGHIVRILHRVLVVVVLSWTWCHGVHFVHEPPLSAPKNSIFSKNVVVDFVYQSFCSVLSWTRLIIDFFLLAKADIS